MAQRIWYVVAEIHNPEPYPFMVLRIDTDIKREGGVEGTVISMHSFRSEAQAMVDRLNIDKALS